MLFVATFQVRPIDKKLQFQIQKLVKAANNVVADKTSSGNKEKEDTHDEDHTRYRPNKDMLENKSTIAAQVTMCCFICHHRRLFLGDGFIKLYCSFTSD